MPCRFADEVKQHELPRSEDETLENEFKFKAKSSSLDCASIEGLQSSIQSKEHSTTPIKQESPVKTNEDLKEPTPPAAFTLPPVVIVATGSTDNSPQVLDQEFRFRSPPEGPKKNLISMAIQTVEGGDLKYAGPSTKRRDAATNVSNRIAEVPKRGQAARRPGKGFLCLGIYHDLKMKSYTFMASPNFSSPPTSD